MELIKELFLPHFFTLLTAPVASGKTKLIIDFYGEHQFKIIFISPLRALANEVFLKLNAVEKNIFLAGGEFSQEDTFTKFINCRKGFLISTMELLSEDFLEACATTDQQILFVLDEFHLFYFWGESFRPILHDRFLAILETGAPVLGITATMGDDLLLRLKEDLKYHFDFWFHLDYGNQKLHRAPLRIHCFNLLKPDLFYRTMWRELLNKERKDVYLVFCGYRSEVDELVARANRMGLVSLGCVGGEVPTFLENLHLQQENLDCIFSTTTLSHGVNLPEIKKVFISYEVSNYDFWLQMVGRGGRLGSAYEVYTFDAFHSKKIQRLKDIFNIYWSDFVGL